MGRFNKYSVVVGAQRRTEKKYLLGADHRYWCMVRFDGASYETRDSPAPGRCRWALEVGKCVYDARVSFCTLTWHSDTSSQVCRKLRLRAKYFAFNRQPPVL